MQKIWRNIEENKRLLCDAAKSNAFIIFDTETTGLKKDDQIIEFAGFKCAYKEDMFRCYDVLHIYIKPDKPVPEEATEVNGITNDFLEDKMSEREVYPIIKSFLGETPVLGAYNSGFDIKMLSAMYRRCGDVLNVGLEVDLLKIARDIFCERKMKDHKLGTIANAYGVDEGINFHSAKDDVLVLVRVLNAMVKDIKENGAEGQMETLKVYRLNYYEGFRGNSRLYVVTSKGMIYYEFKNDKWTPNDEKVDLTNINMQDMENQVFSMAQCSDYKELKRKCNEGKFTYQRKAQGA